MNDLLSLFAILRGMKQESQIATWSRLAVSLSKAVKHSPTWTWRYVQSVAKGTLTASAELRQAVMLLMADLSGDPALPEILTVNVRAVGKVDEGAIVLADSRPCERCGTLFVPRSGNGKKCDRCRRKNG